MYSLIIARRLNVVRIAKRVIEVMLFAAVANLVYLVLTANI